MEIGEDVCIHWTTLYDEILFIHAGSMIVRTDAGEFDCKAGDIVWLPEGVHARLRHDRPALRLFLCALSLRLGQAQRYGRAIGNKRYHQMIDLKGKIALVTGGGRGIGAAIVRKIVQPGGYAVLHDVKIDGRRGRAAEGTRRRPLPSRGRAIWPRIGARRTSGGKAQAWNGRIDVLVNNAGIYESADMDHEFDAWSSPGIGRLQINLVAPGHFCREAIKPFPRPTAAASSSIWPAAPPSVATMRITCTMPRRKAAWWR